MHLSASPPFPIQISALFPILVGVGEVVRHPGWVDAREAVRAGLQAGSPVVLAGAPGVGKSLLLLTLKREFEREGRTVVLLPGGDPGMPARPPDIILLDKAERVPPALLRDLARRARRCVLAGSRGLLGILDGFSIPSLLVNMRPLALDEVELYLREQVKRAGLPNALLDPGAFTALARHSRGNPRRLQALANRALFHAWTDNADEVSATHIAEAVAQDGGNGMSGEDEPTQEVPVPRRHRVRDARYRRACATGARPGAARCPFRRP